MVLVPKNGSVQSWPDLFSRAVGSDSVTLSSNDRLDSHLSKQGRLQITTDEQYVSRFSWSQNMTSLLFCFVSSTITTWYVYWPTTVLITHDSWSIIQRPNWGHSWLAKLMLSLESKMLFIKWIDFDEININESYEIQLQINYKLKFIMLFSNKFYFPIIFTIQQKIANEYNHANIFDKIFMRVLLIT